MKRKILAAIAAFFLLINIPAYGEDTLEKPEDVDIPLRPVTAASIGLTAFMRGAIIGSAITVVAVTGMAVAKFGLSTLTKFAKETASQTGRLVKKNFRLLAAWTKKALSSITRNSWRFLKALVRHAWKLGRWTVETVWIILKTAFDIFLFLLKEFFESLPNANSQTPPSIGREIGSSIRPTVRTPPSRPNPFDQSARTWVVQRSRDKGVPRDGEVPDFLC